MFENGISADCKFTSAPSRYTDASLIKKLEELEIGRPSTYAPTIMTLTKARGYVVKGDKPGEKHHVTNLSLKNGVIKSSAKTETVGAERGRLLPQEIGIIVTDYLVKNFPQILDYKFTAHVEEEFDKIGEEAESLAGLLLELKGDFPKEKEYIQHGSCRFLVLKLDKHRIASIKVRILQRQEPTPERNNDDTNS